jgi:hypothetical protein
MWYAAGVCEREAEPPGILAVGAGGGADGG